MAKVLFLIALLTAFAISTFGCGQEPQQPPLPSTTTSQQTTQNAPSQSQQQAEADAESDAEADESSQPQPPEPTDEYRYDVPAEPSGAFAGHALAMAGYDNSASAPRLFYVDPADNLVDQKGVHDWQPTYAAAEIRILESSVELTIAGTRARLHAALVIQPPGLANNQPTPQKFEHVGVPDLSQHARDNWKCYCAPTAAADVFYYLAHRHSAAWLSEPTVEDFISPGPIGDDEKANLLIAGPDDENRGRSLAALMDLTAEQGTSPEGIRTGVASYIDDLNKSAAQPWELSVIESAPDESPEAFWNSICDEAARESGIILLVQWVSDDAGQGAPVMRDERTAESESDQSSDGQATNPAESDAKSQAADASESGDESQSASESATGAGEQPVATNDPGEIAEAAQGDPAPANGSQNDSQAAAQGKTDEAGSSRGGAGSGGGPTASDWIPPAHLPTTSANMDDELKSPLAGLLTTEVAPELPNLPKGAEQAAGNPTASVRGQLAGRWQQVDKNNDADFFEGGFVKSVVEFHADGSMTVTRTFDADGSVQLVRKVDYALLEPGVIEFGANEKPAASSLIQRPIVFDGSGGQVRISPATQSLPAKVALSVSKDSIQVAGRRYVRAK